MVANLEARPGSDAIVAGNERVLKARLFDAQFFWDQDRKRPLASRVPDLDGVVFHARLGSLGAKAARLETLAGWLAQSGCPGPSPSSRPGRPCCARPIWSPAWSASSPSCKASWAGTTPRTTASRPRSPSRSPSTTPRRARATPARARPVSVAVALADKLDTLVGFFAIGEKPTGSKDPFALRRAALGAIRLILENRLRAAAARGLQAGARGIR